MARAASTKEATSRLTSHSHGAGKRLVEIVDVEDEPALRRGKAAEIHQMAVAAGLHMDAGRRRLRQIGGHHAGGAAVEGERRLQHAAIAQRHQIRLPGRVGGAQDADRVRPARMRPPAGMRIARHACRAAACPQPFRSAGVMRDEWASG